MLERFPILAIRSGENLKRRDLQQMSGRYYFKKFLLTSSNSVNIRYHQGHVNHCKPKGFERFSQMDKVGFGGGAPEQRINFCLKWSKIVQRWAQKGRKWSKKHLGWPFWSLFCFRGRGHFPELIPDFSHFEPFPINLVPAGITEKRQFLRFSETENFALSWLEHGFIL